ncbi:MAG: folate family ECF transporter S component [Clostridia bacterium]|nr:folate family ECF transporter S component [Clostridia bacterium]
MSKKQRLSLRGVTAGAMMAALSIILERVISLMPASNMMDIRISLSNVPIILASIVISPVVGAVAGVVSDIVGCFISGYAPFPILTLAPLLMGLLPGLLLKLFIKSEKPYSLLKVAAVILITHLVCSVLVTTFGLSVMRGVPFIPMLITRLPSCGINLVIDITLVYALLKTPFFKNF